MTRLGGPGCDVVIPGAPEGELHVWSDPAKIIRISGKAALEVDGKAEEEALLSPGQTLRWGGTVMTYHNSVPVIQEISATAPSNKIASRISSLNANDPSQKAWIRAQAGLAIDLGLVPRKTVSRWQEAVLQQEFDPDACALEALAAAEKFTLDDPRVVERSGRLLRDFLMSSLQRGLSGAGRRIRTQAKSGSAFLMANVIGILIYSSMILVGMLLARFKWRVSFDQFFDIILGVAK
jgi:hypothetical protein